MLHRRAHPVACKFLRQIITVDIVEQAIMQARQRCVAHAHVLFEHIKIAEAWPGGNFDLIVLSEILYFLVPADIARTVVLADISLVAGGVILLVNSLKISTNLAVARKWRKCLSTMSRRHIFPYISQGPSLSGSTYLKSGSDCPEVNSRLGQNYWRCWGQDSLRAPLMTTPAAWSHIPRLAHNAFAP